MNKKILEFEIVDHGVEHSDYFQGCGVAFTKFSDVATGIGDSLQEALEDAAEQLATAGFEISAELNSEIESADATDHSNRLPDVTQHTDCGEPECFAEGVYYFASIRIKAA